MIYGNPEKLLNCCIIFLSEYSTFSKASILYKLPKPTPIDNFWAKPEYQYINDSFYQNGYNGDQFGDMIQFMLDKGIAEKVNNNEFKLTDNGRHIIRKRTYSRWRKYQDNIGFQRLMFRHIILFYNLYYVK